MPAKKSLADTIYDLSVPEPNSGCWLWLGGLTDDGYGSCRSTTAHRISYQAFVGPIPDGLEIDHKCRVRCCVNPAHIEPVTHQINVDRRLPYTRANSFKTHCKHGHPLSGGNLVIEIWKGRPARKCRACKNARQRAAGDTWYQAHKHSPAFKSRRAANARRYRERKQDSAPADDNSQTEKQT